MKQSDVMEIFCDNLERIRRERGLTQAEFAAALGTTQSGVSRLLSGNENVSLARAQRIAEALQVDLAELITSCHSVT